jgi:hypothetical protein
MGTSLSPRRYLSTINGKSFEECISFIGEQANALGVSLGDTSNLGDILYAWANYLVTESGTVESIFKEAASLINTTDPHKAYSKVNKLHGMLSGRVGFLDKIFGKNSEMVSAIQAHPFYERFQKETLDSGFAYVSSTYEAFKKIDARVNRVKGELGSIKSKLNSLQEPNLGLDEIKLPGDLGDPLAVAASIDETQRLLELKPGLFYSATATANLANGAAIELAMLWKQAHLVFDLAMSRWLCIAYFGLLLNAAVKHEVSTQALTHLIAAQNDQLKQFGNLISSVTKN